MCDGCQALGNDHVNMGMLEWLQLRGPVINLPFFSNVSLNEQLVSKDYLPSFTDLNFVWERLTEMPQLKMYSREDYFLHSEKVG